MLNFAKGIFSALALAAFANSCGATHHESRLQVYPASESKLGQAMIDSTLLEVRMFQIAGDRSPTFQDLPKSFPVLIINQKAKAADGQEEFRPIGFAINCKGRDPRAVVNAFGEAFLETDSPEGVTEEELESMFQISKQPILRCDALKGTLQSSQMFSQVFRVIHAATGKVHHLLRFNASSPNDKRLYEVGCREIVDAFGLPKNGAIPILESSIKDLPGADELGALHCFNTANSVPEDQTIPQHPAENLPFDARLYRVQDEELGLLRVIITGGRTFRFNCSAADSELQKAFGMPVTGKLDTITADDPAFEAYLKGRMDAQPTLHCPSVSRPEFSSDAYAYSNQERIDPQPVEKNPILRLKAADDTLVQFSCESAARFFAGNFIDRVVNNPSLLQRVTQESTEYLVRRYVPGQLKSRQYQIGCVSDTMNPRIELVQKAFAQVFGVYASSGWIRDLAADIKTKQSAYDLTNIVDYFVYGMAQSESEVNNIASRAFRAAKSREAYEEEKSFFRDWMLKQKKMRPHHDELVAYLRRIKDLPRDELVRSYMEVMNEASSGGIIWWTGEFLSHPDVHFTFDYVVTAHVAWLLLDENTWFLDKIIGMAYKAAIARDIDEGKTRKIRQWVKTDRKVRAHYKELIAYIGQHRNEL